MKLIAGLGNPGPRYERTRHNVGFMVVDELLRRWGAGAAEYDKDYEAMVAEAAAGGQRVLLLKPQTFMNLSGTSVQAASRFYKIAGEDCLIVFDDLDLEPGQLRLRPTGSAGGHKGMADVIGRCGTDAIGRLRIGIGRVHRAATVEHVLGRFAPGERETMERVIELAADAAACWTTEGMTAAMNRFNVRREEDL
jgi:peptidyl-tRNA hydrolase, PTH1 family